MNGIEKIRKKVDALEEQVSPEVNTWMDFMIAVKEGREIILGPAMAGLGISSGREEGQPAPGAHHDCGK